MNTIHTIGYEGAVIDDLIATLQMAEVEVLIDVRDVPVSRKRGFSKKALAEALETAGIRYVHLKALGDPKPGREAAKRGDMDGFRAIFNSHLKGDDAQEALHVAIDISSKTPACLLCYERDHMGCHRTIVAKELADRKAFSVRHLGVREGLAKKARQNEFLEDRVAAFG